MKEQGTRNSKAELLARAEASAWITRLHGPNRTADMEQGFQRWLKERPENAAEFEGLTEVWDLVAGGVPARGVPRLERWEHTAEAQELKALRERQLRPSRASPKLWLAAASGAFVLAVLAVTLYLFGSRDIYTTAIGEQRIVQLDDGTRVSLNSASKLSVRYGDESRLIHLDRGEALFEVAKEPGRPFIVAAGRSRITALATAFVVRKEADKTSVILMEGKVAVTGPDLPAGELDPAARSSATGGGGVVLAPGQRLVLSAQAAPKVDAPSMETVAAWRRGEVALDDTPLQQAVAEMNRYDKTQIVISSPEIDGLIVSGLYHTGDSEGFAHSVAKMYRLKVLRKDGHIELQR